MLCFLTGYCSVEKRLLLFGDLLSGKQTEFSLRVVFVGVILDFIDSNIFFVIVFGGIRV
jgi:hypothetical protein